MEIFKRILLSAILITNTNAVVSSGDLALFQIASNTLSQLKDLKEIITETREFGEEFERVHSKVQQTIYKSDRLAMILEDMKRTQEIRVEDLNSFNTLLARLKTSTKSLQNELKSSYIRQKKSEKRAELSRKKENGIKNRAKKYRSEIRTSISPQQASIDTANTLKDIAAENALLNAKVESLNASLSELQLTIEKQETERIRRELLLRRSNDRIEVGVLKKGEVEI
jgi:hypothetical protein